MPVASLIAKRYLNGKQRFGLVRLLVAFFAVALVVAAVAIALALLSLPIPLIILGPLPFAAVATWVAFHAILGGRRVPLITIIEAISILGIGIGVGALIVVLSVFNGFNSIAIRQLVGFDPHVRITPRNATTLDPDSLLPVIKREPHVVSAAPYIAGRSALVHDEATRVVEVRGIDPRYADTVLNIGSELILGSFDPASGDSVSDDSIADEELHPLLVGSVLAANLEIGTGDEVSLLSREGLELALSSAAQPIFVPSTVTGIFSSQNEFDEHYVFTDIETARRLFEIPEGGMGIEVRLDDFESADEIASSLAAALGPDYRFETWQDMNRDLYGAMQLERWAAFIILLLIVVVAAFNVLGSLTMTVIEKRRDIGILKTMGATDSMVMNIYLSGGFYIGLTGTLIGLVLGVGTCWLQKEFGFYKLDTTYYIISQLPVEMHLIDIVMIVVTAMMLAVGAAIYPSRRAARVRPAEAVRWE